MTGRSRMSRFNKWFYIILKGNYKCKLKNLIKNKINKKGNDLLNLDSWGVL